MEKTGLATGHLQNGDYQSTQLAAGKVTARGEGETPPPDPTCLNKNRWWLSGLLRRSPFKSPPWERLFSKDTPALLQCDVDVLASNLVSLCNFV